MALTAALSWVRANSAARRPPRLPIARPGVILSPMSLDLDPAIEARIQQEFATGRYAAPADLLNQALDLLAAERIDLAARRAAIVARLEESCAQADRGEGVTGEELRARFEARKATFEQSEKVAG